LPKLPTLPKLPRFKESGYCTIRPRRQHGSPQSVTNLGAAVGTAREAARLIGLNYPVNFNFGNFGNLGNFGPPPLVGWIPPDKLRRGLARSAADIGGAKADNVERKVISVA
jgi:hypothetical protein